VHLTQGNLLVKSSFACVSSSEMKPW